jgi:hypothetical protein
MSDKTYKYDVFISYRWIEPDKSWVQGQLEPALENAGLNVLLDAHDFVPGRDLMLEMTRAGKESKRGLCVLSPDYVNDPSRMVNFESLMLRRTDPSGVGSRLIPFILRPTELPDHLANLIAVDWTNPTHHQREWVRLLDVLEAKNRNAPPPGALEAYAALPERERPKPPPPSRPAPPTPSPVWIRKPVWASLAAALLLVVTFGIGYRVFRKPPGGDVITLQGNVYFQQTPGNPGLIAVKDVEVSLSQDSNIRSKRTGSDGKFVLEGVPANASRDLTFEYGGVVYPMAFRENGSYAVIPPDIDSARKFIPTPWVDENQEPCLPVQGLKTAYSKVFKKEIEFQPESGKNYALLTVELVDAPETIILAADVLATPPDSFRNQTLPNEDRKKSHTWKFELSRSAPKPQLLVCLGSDASPAEISSSKLFTYYTLP